MQPRRLPLLAPGKTLIGLKAKGYTAWPKVCRPPEMSKATERSDFAPQFDPARIGLLRHTK